MSKLNLGAVCDRPFQVGRPRSFLLWLVDRSSGCTLLDNNHMGMVKPRQWFPWPHSAGLHENRAN